MLNYLMHLCADQMDLPYCTNTACRGFRWIPLHCMWVSLNLHRLGCRACCRFAFPKFFLKDKMIIFVIETGFDVEETSVDGRDDIEGLDASAAHVANLLSSEPSDGTYISEYVHWRLIVSFLLDNQLSANANY